jgi:hypothetical protein
MRFCFDDVEHLAAEGPDKFAGISRTNATDHSGAEIFFTKATALTALAALEAVMGELP